MIHHRSIWAARNANGAVSLFFNGKPVKDDGWFYDRETFGEGFPLGRRPQLGFTLPRGTAMRVKLRVEAK